MALEEDQASATETEQVSGQALDLEQVSAKMAGVVKVCFTWAAWFPPQNWFSG
jgi:hypothetical protein